MNLRSNQISDSAVSLWIAVLVVVFTFAVLDAATLAWYASFLSAKQAIAEVMTFILIVVGAGVTVWKMKA